MTTPSQSPRVAGDDPLLIVADSDTNADLYYASRFLVPDPMSYLELRGEKILLLKDLELGRARQEASVDRVVAISPFEEALRKAEKRASISNVLDGFLSEQGVERVIVPSSFPVGLARALEGKGYGVDVRSGALFPERAVKTPGEVEAIRSTQRAAERAVQLVIDQIGASQIRDDGYLYEGGDRLTVDWLRREAHKRLLDDDCVAMETIIAPGDQGCDPHVTGTGPIRAHETIIIDIFPRSAVTRYWGDITRTVVRGRASDDAKGLYRDVLDAQNVVFDAVRAGADGQALHASVVQFFEDRGRPTEERDGAKVGYFHGTGHGVGLDIHESPSLGRLESTLDENSVITVEPGLYYPGMGAVRIEDTVRVTSSGFENLTSLPKFLEIE